MLKNVESELYAQIKSELEVNKVIYDLKAEQARLQREVETLLSIISNQQGIIRRMQDEKNGKN